MSDSVAVIFLHSCLSVAVVVLPCRPFQDIVRPVFPLTSMAMTALHGALHGSLREARVSCHMPKPCKCPSLDSCQ